MKINTSILIETLKAQVVGDVIGRIVKGKDIEGIKEKYGAYGFSLENWWLIKEQEESSLHITDKSQITLFALNGLLTCLKNDCIIYNQKKIFNAYYDWYAINNDIKIDLTNNLLKNYPAILKKTAADITTLKNIEMAKNENKIFDLINNAPLDNGLLALVRTIPFAFFAKSDLEAWVYGAQQSAITHGGDKNWQSCAILSLFVFKMLKEYKRIKSSWKKVNKEKETWERYYRQNIDVEKVLRSTTNVASNFINTEKIIDKLKFTMKKIKEGNDYKDVITEYELHENFGEDNQIEHILCVALYIACVSKSFDIAMELSVNNNYDSEVLCSLVAALYVIYHNGASIDNIFNEIEGNIEIEDYLYAVKKEIGDKNFRMLVKEDVSKEELLTFMQMKDKEKGVNRLNKPTTITEKIKFFFRKV